MYSISKIVEEVFRLQSQIDEMKSTKPFRGIRELFAPYPPVVNGAPENLIQQVKRGLGNSSIFSLTTNAEVVSLQVNLD